MALALAVHWHSMHEDPGLCRGQHFGERGERTLDVSGRDRQRRRQPQHVSPRREHEQARGAAGVDDRGDGPVELGAEQEAAARAPRARRAAPARPAASRCAGAPGRSRAARRRSRPRPRRPRRTRRGCRRRSSRGRPGSKPRGAASATSSAPIGRPFASPLASVTRSGSTPSCSKAKNVPVRPTPVCTSSKTSSAPSSSASSRAAARNPGSSGMDAALAQHRLEQDQRRCRRRGAASSDSTSFGAREARRPGRAARSAARFAGWPVAESAPSVRPWKRALERDDPGLRRSPCART